MKIVKGLEKIKEHSFDITMGELLRSKEDSEEYVLRVVVERALVDFHLDNLFRYKDIPVMLYGSQEGYVVLQDEVLEVQNEDVVSILLVIYSSDGEEFYTSGKRTIATREREDIISIAKEIGGYPALIKQEIGEDECSVIVIDNLEALDKLYLSVILDIDAEREEVVSIRVIEGGKENEQSVR